MSLLKQGQLSSSAKKRELTESQKQQVREAFDLYVSYFFVAQISSFLIFFTRCYGM